MAKVRSLRMVPHMADGGYVDNVLAQAGRGLRAYITGANNPTRQEPVAPSPPPPPAPPANFTPSMDPSRKTPSNPAGISFFADGGRVQGPGTPTSDSVPTRLSREEYVLPADTVKAVGVNKLDALRRATHTPVMAKRGMADGGIPGVDDPNAPVRRPTLRGIKVTEGMPDIPDAPVDRASLGNTAVTEGAPAISDTPPKRPSLSGMSVNETPMTRDAAKTFVRDPGPGNPNVGAGGSAEAQAFRAPPAAAAEAVAPAAEAAVARPGVLRTVGSALRGVAEGGAAATAGYLGARALRNIGNPADGTKGSYAPPAAVGQIPTEGYPKAPDAQPYNFFADNEVGRNISNTANALSMIPVGVGAGFVGRAGAAMGTAGGVGRAAVDGLAAGAGAAEPSSQAPAAGTSSSAAPTTPSTPVVTAPPVTPTLRNNITRAGNSYSGSNITGDSPTINGQPLGSSGGAISPQNMAAGDALGAQAYQDSLGRVAAAAPSSAPQYAVPASSANSWLARNNLRNQEVSASSIVGTQKERLQRQQAFLAAQAADNAAAAGTDPATLAAIQARSGDYRAGQDRAGREYTADAGLRGNIYDANSRAAVARVNNERALRTMQFDRAVKLRELDNSETAANFAARQAAEKSLPDRIAAQLPPGPDGKPDAANAAHYAAAVTTHLAQREAQLEQHLKLNPGDSQAASELQGIRTRGPAQMDDGAVRKLVLGQQAADLAAANASNINPFAGKAPVNGAPITSLRLRKGVISDDYVDPTGQYVIPARAVDNVGGVFGIGGHPNAGLRDLIQR